MTKRNSIEKSKATFFHQLRPIHRWLLATLLSLLFIKFVDCGHNRYFTALVVLDIFSAVYLLLCWIVLLTMPIQLIKKNAAKEDGSKVFVFTMIILSSIAGMISVLLLVLNNDASIPNALFLTVCISGIVLSWAIVHTIFTFHYARMYYSGNAEGGLEFPGNERPDYIDFAYFSFVVGCTFQVSDVEISDKKIRRLALVHGLLAFILNTFVVALSINIISGLAK